MVESITFAFSRAFHVLVMAVRVLIYVSFFWIAGPVIAGAVHGAVFPVMVSSETYISQAQPASAHVTKIWGTARRRQDCDFVSLKWYYGKRNDRRVPVSVGLRFLEKPKIRPKGGMTFGPWVVRISIRQLFNSHADVIHENCRIQFAGLQFTLPWQVKSRFYDGDIDK